MKIDKKIVKQLVFIIAVLTAFGILFYFADKADEKGVADISSAVTGQEEPIPALSTDETVSQDNNKEISEVVESGIQEQSDLEEMQEVVSNFLKSYFYVNTMETGRIDPHQQYQNYADYLTKQAQKEMYTESDGEDGEIYYINEILGSNSYYALPIKGNNSLLAITYSYSRYEDGEELFQTQIYRIGLKQEDGRWKVDTISEGQAINSTMFVTGE